MSRLLKRLFKFQLIGRMIGLIMEYLSGWLPVDRLYETPRLIAFNHPWPSYDIHVLIVPKKAIRSLMTLDESDEDFLRQFLSDLIVCVQSLVKELDLEDVGYRLINNGGNYQDVPQLHFHLVSGSVLD